MAAADPPPPQYIGLPGAGIENQGVRNMLQRAALADFKHDFGGLKVSDALREAIAQIPEGTPYRGQKILRAKKGLGGQGGTIYGKYINRMHVTIPNGVEQGQADSEDTILDTVLGIPLVGVAPQGQYSFANIKYSLVNKSFLPPGGFNSNIIEGTQIQGNTYQIRGCPVKWKVNGDNHYEPLPDCLGVITNGIRNIVLMIDASFFAFSTLKQIDTRGGPYNIFILSNIENDSDPATKIKEFTGDNPNVRVFFLKEKDPNFPANYPLVDDVSRGRDSVFFSRYTLQSRRNEEQAKANIDAKLTERNGRVFQTINNLGNISEINKAGMTALKEYIESIEGDGAPPQGDILQKMMNYFMLKRAGDWCQALSLADTTREYHVYDHRFNLYNGGINAIFNPPQGIQNGEQTVTTLQQLQQKNCEIALVTHDRILLAFALYNGINAIFSTDGLVSAPPNLPDGIRAHPLGITSVNWMVYFKNMATQAGDDVMRRLINQKIAEMNTNLNAIRVGLGNINMLNIPPAPLDNRNGVQDAINGHIEQLNNFLDQKFQQKVNEILVFYSEFINNNILGPNQTIHNADNEIANLKFKQYVHYFRLMLFQLSELIHPSTIGVIDGFNPAGEVPTLNKYSAIENYIKKVKDTLEKNGRIIPGRYNNQDIDREILFKEGIKDASPLPPNDHKQTQTINAVRIFGGTPNYNRRKDPYNYIQIGPIDINGIRITSKKGEEAPQKNDGDKVKYKDFYTMFYKNNADQSGELFTFFKIIKGWGNIPLPGGEIYNNNQTLTSIVALLPLRLGGVNVDTLPNDNEYRTTQHDIHDKFIDLLPVDLHYPGWDLPQAGGAKGDDYIKSELRSEKMYTLPLQAVRFTTNNLGRFFEYQRLNNAGDIIKSIGIHDYRIDIGEYYNNVEGENRFNDDINIGFEADVIDILIYKAKQHNLMEPYFTNYVKDGFYNIYKKYLEWDTINHRDIIHYLVSLQTQQFDQLQRVTLVQLQSIRKNQRVIQLRQNYPALRNRNINLTAQRNARVEIENANNLITNVYNQINNRQQKSMETAIRIARLPYELPAQLFAQLPAELVAQLPAELQAQIDVIEHHFISVRDYIVENYEEIMKQRGSSYYDVNNNQITVIDDYVIDSKYENVIKDILKKKFLNFDPDRVLLNQVIQIMPGLNPPLHNQSRTTIPFFIYRFLLYYLDTILTRIRKLDEYTVGKEIQYEYNDVHPPIAQVNQIPPIILQRLNNRPAFNVVDPVNGLVPGDFTIQGNIVYICIDPQGHYIQRTYTEENLTERYKLMQELNALFGLVYTNFMADDPEPQRGPGEQRIPRRPRFYWDRFERIKTYFLQGVNVPLPGQPPVGFNYLQDFNVPLLENPYYESHLPSKQELYNRAKIVQFINIIFYYIFMLDGYKQFDYVIQHMISDRNTKFLQKFLEIDEAHFLQNDPRALEFLQNPANPANQQIQQALRALQNPQANQVFLNNQANQGNIKVALEVQTLQQGHANIIEKGLLRSFKDFLVGNLPVPVPAPPPPTQFENIMAGLGFYDPPTKRNHIIRPIFQSLNTIIRTVNGIGLGNIVDEIDILALAPQLGGAIQRKTRKQRKTHRGVKTRSTKPRKQSPRRHKKRSKKTRKH